MRVAFTTRSGKSVSFNAYSGRRRKRGTNPILGAPTPRKPRKPRVPKLGTDAATYKGVWS